MSGKDAQLLPDIYDPAFIHADVDLVTIAGRLKDSRSARLYLYGPPDDKADRLLGCACATVRGVQDEMYNRTHGLYIQ